MGAATANSVASRDGTPIAYFCSGAGRPLVLVHGTSANHGRWDPVLGLLERRFTLYAVDRRGRGASGDGPAYALEREIDDVVAVLSAVADAGAQRPVLLGHSWGGICALEAAGAWSGDLDALILYEPPIPVGVEIYQAGVLDRLRALLDRGDHEEILIAFMADVVQVPPERLEQMRAQPGWSDRVAAAHTLVREVQAHVRYRFDPDRFRALEVPTLLLLGADSPPFFAAAIDALHAALANSTMVVMAGQQHAAMDTAPQLFSAEIVRFVAALA